MRSSFRELPQDHRGARAGAEATFETRARASPAGSTIWQSPSASPYPATERPKTIGTASPAA